MNIESQMSEMYRRNTAPVENGKHFSTTQSGSFHNGVSQGYNLGAYQPNYSHHSYEEEGSNGYANSSRANHVVQPKHSDGMFMISKQNKKSNRDMYHGQFDYDQQSYVEYSKKPRKRGAKERDN